MRLLSPSTDTGNRSWFESMPEGDTIAFEHPGVVWYLSVSFAGICTAVTVVANMLTVFVLVRHRPLQKSISNLYILSLSVADCLIGLLVMITMAIHAFVFRLEWFFGPRWMCDAWQVADFTLSTISLYSICAIALDRCWNLEKPLRIFKRSRKLARRLVFCIWLMPIVIWIPVYFLFTDHRQQQMPSGNLRGDNPNRCFTQWHTELVVPFVAVPVLYVPAAILIAMFVRISLVVHRHLKFLRDHSNNPKGSATFCNTITNGANSNSNSAGGGDYNTKGKSREVTPLRTPEVTRKLTDNSQTTISSGYCTNTLRSQSPRVLKTEWQLAPLSEEKSSGREQRSQSEQMQMTPELQQELSSGHLRIAGVQSVPTRAQSMKRRHLILAQRGTDLFHSSSAESFVPRRRPSFLTKASSEPSPGSPSGVMRRISAFSRTGSGKRFSVIAIPSNLAELLHREGVSQQVRAAKAVALILCCFLLCWLPFLTLWPIKVFCSSCVPDSLYLTSIWLNYLCSTLNPLLYTLSSPRVRVALRHYLSIIPRSSNSRLRKPSFYRSITIV